ncbi:MAG: hypothetical protein HGB34_02945 [Candidatus Moranbacteria bacterium]|nr:hypothetical protein [Candidatus Moranbacteria bacterium]NTW75835.1 hypothetical protein [Candidatus Moranbacteria bacterium]
MADFRTHAAFGVGLGAILAVASGTLGLLSGPTLLVPVFLCAALGALAPDIDSDSGVPFHVTFGALSIVSGGFVLSSCLASGVPVVESGLYSIGAAAAVWIVAGGVFKRLTNHRGMAHSLPAAFLAGLLVFFAAGCLSYGDSDAFLLGTAVSFGYLVHLVLDEVYAAVDFHGRRIMPSGSLGSALKISSSSRFATGAVYLGIVMLLAGNVTRLLSLARAFWETVR